MTGSIVTQSLSKILDLSVYVAGVTIVVFSIGAVASLVIGGRWVLVEAIMFVIGILLFGYGTFLLRPAPPWDAEETDEGKLRVTMQDGRGDVINSRDPSRFESFLERVPLVNKYLPAPENRLSIPVKVFLSSLGILLTSYLIERLLVV
jgi:hypothetical protein